MKEFNVLVVDDEYSYQEVFKILLEKAGYTVYTCDSGEAAIKIVEDKTIDLILTDLRMNGMSGIELLEDVKRISKVTEIIIITGYGTIEGAVEAMKKGAFSYFIKGQNVDALIMEIEKLVKIKKLEEQNLKFKNDLMNEEVSLESKSPIFIDILSIAKKAAMTNTSILILGESGTGKEVLAKYIHKLSSRYNNSFVAVNCHTFSDGLLESELFGHEKGAFTGANEKRIGRFEEANGGTLFLDEIGDMPLNVQVKLLRAIETKSIERIGNNKNISIDFRIISATNKDITKSIDDMTFREDLLYRINTITIELPALRDRVEDLPDLINFFTKKISIELKKKIKYIEEELMSFLLNYHYPGNIRELKNIIERLIVLSEDGVLTYQCLPLDQMSSLRQSTIDSSSRKSLREYRSIIEKDYILEVLLENDWSINLTAKKLGISTRQLSNKINEYKLNRN